ncbi:MAG: hypothetical protein AAB402_02985 [Patescibacteria group bacterium]
MSDRDTTVVTADAGPSRPPDLIGTLVDHTAPRFPGKLYEQVGFGADLPLEAEQAWLAALVIQPKRRRWRDTPWWSGDAVRERYRTATRRWYGYSGIPLADTRLHEMLDYVRLLRPQRVYDGLSFEQVMHPLHRPSAVIIPHLPTVLTWRHAPFARNVVGDRLPHLRTREMVQPDEVWNRLIVLFRDYCSLLRRRMYARLTPLQQTAEMISFYLALYERLLYLWYAESTRQVDYLAAVADRRPRSSEDPVLALDDQPHPDISLDLLLTRRQVAYHRLIRILLQRVVDQLASLAPAHSDS